MINTALLNKFMTIAVVCTQWGDTGKGKFVDLLADWADIVARGTGGANAGHTICYEGKEFVFHLLPSGMLHGKLNIIGSGVAVDPRLVLQEMRAVRSAGVEVHDKLRIALNAILVLPHHVVLDRVREGAKGDGKIGTTGRGMGPAYTDHVARLGLTMNDLLNPDVFVRKLRRNLEEKTRVLKTYNRELVKKAFAGELGAFYSDRTIFDEDAIASVYLKYGRSLEAIITDTDELVRNALGSKRILLEGAQGNLLSVDYGTYPYVTSSDCSVRGLAKGVGIRTQDVGLTLGIVKAPYMTRVGEGPFPTELGGERSAEHCRTATRETELAFQDPSLGDPDEFILGVAIRRIGKEYGATTGRPRRTGWLDLPLVRYSAQYLSGPNVILTKLDVLDGAPSIRICDAYVYRGPNYQRGDRVYRNGDEILVAIPDIEIMRYCEPRYSEHVGWRGPIRAMKTYRELPLELRNIINYVEREANVNVIFLSVGADREETIDHHQPIAWK